MRTYTEDDITPPDRVCECGHFYLDHGGGCSECDCERFRFSAENSHPEAIFRRGLPASLWPQHVADYFDRT